MIASAHGRPRSPLVLSAALLAALALTQCDRAPAEPVATADARPKAPARCVRKTPDTPPPAVPKGPDPRCPRDPEGNPPTVPMGKVSFPSSKTAPELQTELMLTERHRERGLMFRQQMTEDHGMLFVFEDVAPRTFWMRNTCLPLDMLFVNDDGFIAGIVENVPTMNDEPRGIPCPVRFVLEVNAGFARRHGVVAGQMLKIEGLPKPASP